MLNQLLAFLNNFERDNDDNYHINFILSFSNLRANNYNIEKINFLNVKEIAGNIIPAIVPTTTAVTGISCLQIYTLLQTDNLRSFINCDLNLGISLFDLFIPENKRYIKDFKNDKNILEKKVIPREYTVLDKIDIIGPNKTVKNIVDDFKDKYNVDIDYLNYNNYTLASPFDGKDDFDSTIESLLKENNIKIPYFSTESFDMDVSYSVIASWRGFASSKLFDYSCFYSIFII